MTYRGLLAEGKGRLLKAGADDAEFDAFQLLLSVLKTDISGFILKENDSAGKEETDIYLSLIKRREDREPLQYIIGHWDFYNSVFSVGSGVFIPRAETEQLAGLCIDGIRKNGYKIVYDLCAGSGCIGLSIAAECPDAHCFLFEYMEGALRYTEKNAADSGLKNVSIVKCDVLKGKNNAQIPKPDLIVSNPPYIITDEIAALQPEVLREPFSALDGGSDGLCFYRAIADLWLPELNENGFAAVECGENQCGDIIKIFGGRLNGRVIQDTFGAERFVAGKKI